MIEPTAGTPGLEPFAPPRLMAGRHVQSVLASLPLRRPLVERRVRDLLRSSTDVLVDCGHGIRLHGYFSPRCRADQRPPRGLAVLIHGWEGSSDSLYQLSTAHYLRQRGFDVFRLNLRDHGPSHHLNPELFHSNRIDEVVTAVARIGEMFPDVPLLLGGYSLGGNFALRVGVRAPAAGINLHQIVAVCPVLELTCMLRLRIPPLMPNGASVRTCTRVVTTAESPDGMTPSGLPRAETSMPSRRGESPPTSGIGDPFSSVDAAT